MDEYDLHGECEHLEKWTERLACIAREDCEFEDCKSQAIETYDDCYFT